MKIKKYKPKPENDTDKELTHFKSTRRSRNKVRRIKKYKPTNTKEN